MRTMLIVALAVSAGACSEPTPETTAPAAPSAEAPALQILAWEDVQGRLSGELGCAFRDGEGMLLVAMGDVSDTARSEAVVKRDGVVVQLPAAAVGGFSALLDGETFTAAALTAEVRTGAEQEAGHEGTVHDATLITRDAVGDRSYQGIWSCGP